MSCCACQLYLCCLWVCVCVCFCLAALPVNELVTCISHSVPRYFLLADCFLPPPLPPPLFSPPLLHSVHVFLFHGSVLFTFTVDGNHRRRKMQPGTKLFSPLSFSSFSFFVFLNLRTYGQTGIRACLGFPNSSLRQGSLESNPTIIAGRRGLAGAGEKEND